MLYIVLHLVPPQVSLSHEILKLRRHEKNVTVDCYGSGKPRPAVTWKRGQNDVPVFAVITANETNQVPQTCFSNHFQETVTVLALASCLY